MEQLDGQGLEVLSRPQCLRLLRRHTVGRVVLSVDALPAAFPVNFAVMGDDVVFRSAPGTKLSAALDGAVVAFEVDRIDPVRHSGWSVLIRGAAEVLETPADLARAHRLKLRPSAPGDRPYFVRIRSRLVSGRRFLSPTQALAASFASGAEEVRHERLGA